MEQRAQAHHVADTGKLIGNPLETELGRVVFPTERGPWY